MAGPQRNTMSIMLIVSMLVFGSWNTLNTKWQFQTCVPTLDPQNHKHCVAGQRQFNKPWMQNIVMFWGEASLIIVYVATGGSKRRELAASGAAAVHEAREGPLLQQAPLRKTPFYIFAVPAFCDVFGTGLASVGMQYMDAAIWQMLRSSIIIFSAILSVLFLKRRLQPFHWVATAIVAVGLVVVGVASALDATSSTDSKSVSMAERLFGMGLVVFAQLCASFQMCFEEMLLTGRVKTSAKKVVGMEGLWGGWFMVIILTIMTLVPGDDDGVYESVPDSFHMIFNSPMLTFLLITYMCSIAVYNLTGIMVGKRMSAVVRCLIDSCRTITVWGLSLIIGTFSEEYGSKWTPHSWMTVIGFLILAVGTLLYNEVLPPPEFLRLPAAPQENSVPQTLSGLDDILAKVDLTDENEENVALCHASQQGITSQFPRPRDAA